MKNVVIALNEKKIHSNKSEVYPMISLYAK